MNLQFITEGIISAVNVPVLVSIQQSTGSTKNADFSSTPTYATYSMYVDLQALSYKDLEQANQLNIQGERRKMYVTGQIDGLVRYASKNGDLVTITDPTNSWNGTVWKVAMVDEYWQGWNSSIITLQNGS